MCLIWSNLTPCSAAFTFTHAGDINIGAKRITAVNLVILGGYNSKHK